jgi:hypothetical protein
MYRNNLIDYLPPFIRTIRECESIMNDGEQPEIELAWEAIENTMNDQFISDATENGVQRWERILGIVPKSTWTLEERKFTLLSKVNEKLPFTITTLREQLKTLCGENNYSADVDGYTLIVRVALAAKNNIDDVASLLERIVPANMVIDLSIKYNPHETLENHTHEELHAYTHEQLRNEVIANGN